MHLITGTPLGANVLMFFMRLICFWNIISLYIHKKNFKTFAPIGAPVIRCKYYWVQLVRGPTGFHHCNFMFHLYFNGLPHSMHDGNRHASVSVFDNISFLIHLNFTPLAGIIFYSVSKYMDMLKSLKLRFSTRTGSWSFVKCPFRFASSSHSLQA